MNITDNTQLKTIIRYFVGFVFIGSALLKFLSIDSFEVYIYSFGLLKYNTALLFARLVISIEILLGTLLILGIYIKQTIIVSSILLLLFCAFIGYLFITNNEEHCHCFGDFIELSHGVTILKNIGLIVLLLYNYKSIESRDKYKKWFLFVSLVLSFSLPIAFSFPHAIFNNIYSNSSSYNEVLLKDFLQQNKQYTQGRQILCFFGTGCKYCKLASKKLSIIATKINDKDIIKVVFWGTEESVITFYKETNSISFKYTFLPPEKLLKITEGAVPLIFLLENGIIKGTYNYGNINETAIINFITE